MIRTLDVHAGGATWKLYKARASMCTTLDYALSKHSCQRYFECV